MDIYCRIGEVVFWFELKCIYLPALYCLFPAVNFIVPFIADMHCSSQRRQECLAEKFVEHLLPWALHLTLKPDRIKP